MKKRVVITGTGIVSCIGTNHSGLDTTSAAKASTVELSDHRSPTAMELPCLRSNCGKRLRPTNRTNAGVISSATNKSEDTMMTGVTAKTTMSGPATTLNLPTPTASSQPQTWLNRLDDSNTARTHCRAGSQ